MKDLDAWKQKTVELWIQKILPFLCKYGYLIVNFFLFLFMDVVFRRKFNMYGIYNYKHYIPMLFSISWCLLFTAFLYICPKKWKCLLSVCLTTFFAVYILGQTVHFNLFYKYLTVLDISLLKEGTEFADTSYFHVNYSILIVCILAIVFSFLIYRVKFTEVKSSWKNFGILCGICLVCNCAPRMMIPTVDDSSAWNASNQPGNIYQDYTNTTKALLMSGVYEYALRDVYLAYNPFKNINQGQIIKEIDAYVESKTEHVSNDRSGKLKDKNVIFVQLENIDNWMLTKETMPNLYGLKSESMDFTNHYATAFASGKTFNTEFIVNTGLIPQTKGSAPSYIYSRNSYPYSLPNLFKNAGYTANSYHAAAGHIYNREAVHKTFGYEKYHSNADMGMEDWTMDSQMTNQFDVMVKSDKFMDYVITYSGHGPFRSDLKTCSTHLDEVKAYANSDDTVYLCGLAQAKETDLMIGNLVKELKDRNLYENTVLVFYADHYAYGTIDSATELKLKGTNDPNLLSNVSFFIWSKDLPAEEITKITGTMDILPTIANLFDLDADYRYFVGNDIFSDYDDYVFFQDGAILNKDHYLQTIHDNITDQEKEQVKNADTRLQMSWDMLTTDYLKGK